MTVLAHSETRLSRLLAGVLALACAVFVTPARAQIHNIDPYWAVVVDPSHEGVLLRSGDGKAYYPVATLKDEQVVHVTGEGQNWLQVDYPRFVTALISAEEVDAFDGKTRVKLTTESHLKAIHAEYGVRGSWKRLFEPPLPAGTVLTVVKTHTADDGHVTYEVTPPDGAHGYIFSDSLRRATPAEIEAHLAKLAQGEAAPAKEDSNVDVVALDADPAQAQPTSTPTAESTIEPAARSNEPREVIALNDPIAAPDQGVTIEPLTPTQQPELPVTQPRLTDPDRPGVDELPATEIVQTPAERPLLTTEQLVAAFDRVMKQESLDAEYDQLINEFQRTLTRERERDASRTTLVLLDQRLSLLQVRQGIQQSQQKIAESRREASENDVQLARQLAELDQTRVYELVGRLVPSTIYDGVHLPRLYRLQSVGTPLPRTLGYIRADQFEGLDRRVGQIVGVLGKPSLDQNLKLRVIAAERVDLITPNVRTTSVPTSDE